MPIPPILIEAHTPANIGGIVADSSVRFEDFGTIIAIQVEGKPIVYVRTVDLYGVLEVFQKK